ncbi:2-keto-4-pentenoate hydratase/2-oxohepta-3-ene-1,7-dioic acid hydratase in catechol pathway [Naumannella cuiyingiana]|uniref:2-keto-4-pentenoate hydratase/2-oxohepta-3-ene-1,7-dioic acid hydratase in catechol pathway n=1 Tax=Naumannella cuiyingiana TaxID=1347891 RepID=A0A7Z0DBX8_9ACTN|nr:fumarylacetoacetate hydrolase family protein [Naumannella cuiyingiana]NYI72474.1 2-keto-4-pentenoate hydratase/2-oxohepta-3-ene-1,7-dioic acid hydratase in catechol pathway [Naumannella cuiyingiana]
MRVARFSTGGEPRYGLVELARDNGEHPDTVAVLNGDPLAMPVQLTGERLALDAVRLLAPVIPRSKVIGVGRNYADHAKEMGNEVPATPLTFFKPNTAVIGPDDRIIAPAAAKELHFEGELAVVIGRIGSQVPADRAQDLIFGYTVANDATLRDLQRTDGQWARAKGFDTSCPLGPWIVTHLTIEEAGELELSTSVDGEQRQAGNTRDLVHPIADLVAYISSYTTLLPGDVILTGTPAGVGEMRPGQTVSVHIEGIGTLTNTVGEPGSSAISSGRKTEQPDEQEKEAK